MPNKYTAEPTLLCAEQLGFSPIEKRRVAVREMAFLIVNIKVKKFSIYSKKEKNIIFVFTYITKSKLLNFLTSNQKAFLSI